MIEEITLKNFAQFRGEHAVDLRGVRFLGLVGPNWCLSGDAVVGVNRAGNGKRMKLRDLVRGFNQKEGRDRRFGWDHSIPTRIQSKSPDGFVKLHRLVAAHESGQKRTHRIELVDGRSIRASIDHLFDTPGGWKRLGELEPGQSVIADVGRITSGRAPKKTYRVLANLPAHPHARHRPRCDHSQQWAVRYHRVVFEAFLNGLSFDRFVERIRSRRIDGLVFLDPARVHVHHKDGDTRNNVLSNLEAIPATEHLREHGSDQHWKHVTRRVGAVQIAAIRRCGLEDTFDLTMEGEPHNFIADGFVVHNSGKTHVVEAVLVALQGRTRAKSQSLAELVSWGETRAEVGVRIGGPAPFRIVRRFDVDGGSEVVMEGLEDARKRDVVEAVSERLGLTYDDLISTAFVRQSSLLGLAELDPAPLRAMFARWTDRPEWGALYKRAKGLFDACDREIAVESARTRYAGPGVEGMRAELEALRASKVEAVVDEAAVAAKRATRATMEKSIAKRRHDLAELEATGKEQKAKVADEEVRKKLAEDLERNSKILGVAEAKQKNLRVIQSRGFDGECPVDASVTCPIAGEITENLRANTAARTGVDAEVKKARADVDVNKRSIREVEAADRRLDDLRAEYVDLAGEIASDEASAAELDGDVADLLNPTLDPAKVAAREQAIGALEARIADAEAAVEKAKEAEKRVGDLHRRRSALAFVVFATSKAGIPAAEASSDLSWIERDASALLESLGIGFGAAFREERELKSWASQCPACGDLVDGERCTCGLPRQREKRDELRIAVTFPGGAEIPLVSHSGGGQAFVAFALRVAAFRLLRLRRGCAWGTMVLDEVRRALSPEMGRALSQAVARVVGDGVDQVIDIVHGTEQSAAERVLEVVPVGTPERPRSELRWAR